MTTAATRTAIGLGLLAVLLGCGGLGDGAARKEASRTKGAKEATVAFAAGQLALREYPPLPAPAWHGEYIKLLRDRGIGYEVPALPPGAFQEDFIHEVRGWNEVMQAEIERRHGAGLIGRLRDEAQKTWEEHVKGAKG